MKDSIWNLKKVLKVLIYTGKHYNNHFYENASFNLKTLLNLHLVMFDQEPSPLITVLDLSIVLEMVDNHLCNWCPS